jgi:hypothetical protein
VIHTQLGKIECDGLGRWTAHMEIYPDSSDEQPQRVYKVVYARDKEQLLKRMEEEARVAQRILASTLHMFQEARRRGEI